MENTIPNFGRRLAAIRKKHGLTQTELSKKLGIAVETIKYYETQSKNPTLGTLQKVCSAFGVTLDELLYDNKINHPGPESEIEKRLHQIEDLPRGQQKKIIAVIDTMLAVH